MDPIQTYIGSLAVETCCNCGTVFGVEQGLHAKHLSDSEQWFFCPNGHRQHYTETEAARLKRELAAAVSSRDRAFARAEELRVQRDGLGRQLRSTKGVVTRIKNRVGRGVCPCCSRSFTNLRRHMATQHADFTATP